MKLIISAALLAFSAAFFAPADPIPAPVKDAFFKLYPSVDDAEIFWECNQQGIVATFENQRALTKAFFDETGNWQESHIRLYLNQMPIAIQQLLKKHLRETDITFMGKVVFPDGSQLFRIESEDFDEVVIKHLDQQGGLIEERHIPFTEGLEVW
jgi:hypothetical protein